MELIIIIMESFITAAIILGIPAIFLILCIKNILEIVESKNDKITVKKSLIIKSIIFGVIFIVIVVLYICVMYSLSVMDKIMI